MLDMIERTSPTKPWMKDYTFVLIQSLEELEDVITRAIKNKRCAFDLESTGLDTRVFKGKCKTHVVGYSFSFEPKIGYYVPIRHKIETSKGKNLDPASVNKQVKRLIDECSVIGHNWLKFDIEMLYASEGIDIRKFSVGEEYPHHDTYILARLAGMQPAGLKWLSKSRLNKEMLEITDIVPSKTNIDFGSVSPFEGYVYAASDAICTNEIFDLPEIKEPMKDQKRIYTIERKLTKVVRKLERNKIKLDKVFCEQLDRELLDSISNIEKSIFDEVCEKTNNQIKQFQLDSPDEVSNILFNIYDMNPKPEKGKKGNYKTDDEALEKLAPNYPLAKKLQEYRTLTKFHRTYIRNMMLNVDEEGYLKFNFSQLKTDSGRFASPGKSEDSIHTDGYSGVNIQATPARYDKSKPNVRKCISCEQDEVIAALDWSGVEIRVACNMSREPIWLDRFLNGDGDLHTSTASIIYEIPETKVTKEERQTGKTFNFQSIYGGGPGALASTIGITMDDAKEKQQRFFGRLQTLKDWIKGLQREAEKKGYCLTKFGRKRMLPEFSSDIPKIRANAARKSVNTPVQGTAADLMKLAMISIDHYIEDNNLTDKVQMLLTMHDELVFRVKKSHVDVLRDIEKVMELEGTIQKIKWEVPLKVDVEIGSSWDVKYEYWDMVNFLKEKHGVSEVAYIYQEGRNYEEFMIALDAWKKEKKAKKESEPKVEVSNAGKGLAEFRNTGTEIVEDTEQQISELTRKEAEPAKSENKQKEKVFSSEKTATAEEIDGAFSILKSVNLSDLPEEAYVKLKKSFYEKEVKRILEGKSSEDDCDVELAIPVHAPIDEAKKNALGYIIDSCPGKGRVKFMTIDKEDLHEDFMKVDVVRVAVMCKIFNI